MKNEEVVREVTVYYCTELGKVKGKLQVSQSRIFFEPMANCHENELFKNELRRFEACIDMGDVVAVSKKTLINQSGAY